MTRHFDSGSGPGYFADQTPNVKFTLAPDRMIFDCISKTDAPRGFPEQLRRVLNNFSFITRPAKPSFFQRFLTEERKLERIRKLLDKHAQTRDDPALWPMRTRFRHLPLTVLRENRHSEGDGIAIEQFDRLLASLAKFPDGIISLADIEEVFLTGKYIAFQHYIA